MYFYIKIGYSKFSLHDAFKLAVKSVEDSAVVDTRFVDISTKNYPDMSTKIFGCRQK